MSSINTTSTRWAMFLHLKLSILEGGAVNARPTSRPQFTGLRRELHFLQNNGVAKRKRSFIGSRGFGQKMTSCPIDLCAGCLSGGVSGARGTGGVARVLARVRRAVVGACGFRPARCLAVFGLPPRLGEALTAVSLEDALDDEVEERGDPDRRDEREHVGHDRVHALIFSRRAAQASRALSDRTRTVLPMPTRTTARRTPGFRCAECGWTTAKWVGRCGECQAWGTVAEVGGATATRTTAASVATPAQRIADVDVS